MTREVSSRLILRYGVAEVMPLVLTEEPQIGYETCTLLPYNSWYASSSLHQPDYVPPSAWISAA
jgi:hypothetical protein